MKKNDSSVKSAVAKQPREAFLADAMLGSLARKMRIFGFDTEYLADTDDDEVLRRGILHGRVILTADREFFKRIVKHGARGVLVSGKGDLEDMAKVMLKLALSPDNAAIGSRCTACNGLLKKVSRKGAIDAPPAVLDRHSQFYRCVACSKLYWKGGHMEQISSFAIGLRSRMAKG